MILVRTQARRCSFAVIVIVISIFGG